MLTVTDIVSAVPIVEAVASRVVAADDFHVALVGELHLDGLRCVMWRCVAVFAVEATSVTQAVASQPPSSPVEGEDQRLRSRQG